MEEKLCPENNNSFKFIKPKGKLVARKTYMFKNKKSNINENKLNNDEKVYFNIDNQIDYTKICKTKYISHLLKYDYK